MSLSSTVLTSTPFPPAVRTEFEAYLVEDHNPVIQRVSKKSFVVATPPTSESPLGLLHVRIGPNNNVQCTCHKYKRAISLAGATTAPKLSKRCTHFYLFLWAALSYDSLKKEFSLGDNGKHRNYYTNIVLQIIVIVIFFCLGITISTTLGGSTTTCTPTKTTINES